MKILRDISFTRENDNQVKLTAFLDSAMIHHDFKFQLLGNIRDVIVQEISKECIAKFREQIIKDIGREEILDSIKKNLLSRIGRNI